jgi:hypothetical protein
VAGEEARFAFARPMFWIEQIENDFRPRHFGFVCEWQFHFEFSAFTFEPRYLKCYGLFPNSASIRFRVASSILSAAATVF